MGVGGLVAYVRDNGAFQSDSNGPFHNRRIETQTQHFLPVEVDREPPPFRDRPHEDVAHPLQSAQEFT